MDTRLAIQTKRIEELEAEINKIKKAFLVICSNCKKIRDQDDWIPIEDYLLKEFGIKFSHGICPDCYKVLYPDL